MRIDSRWVGAKACTIAIWALLAVPNVLKRRISDDTDVLRLLFEVLAWNLWAIVGAMFAVRIDAH